MVSIAEGPVAAMSKAKKTSGKSKTRKKSSGTRNSLSKTSKTRTQSVVNRERRQTEQEIKQTRQAINENTRKTRQNLDRLNNLDAQISRQESTISSLSTRLDTINTRISYSEDSIAAIEAQVAQLRSELREDLRGMRSHRRRVNSLAFIFSAQDFNTASHRYSYLRQLRTARSRKIAALRDALALLDGRRAALLTLRQQHSSTLTQLNMARQMMETQQGQARQLARQLSAEGRSLQQILAEKRRRAQQLDAELNRIIEAEAQAAAAAERKRQQRNNTASTSGNTSSGNSGRQTGGKTGTAEADRRLSGPFSSNKGRLLFPVAGNYTITGTFGRSTRHGMAIDNSGIDISVAPGTKARAVFDGTVTSVFMMPTYHNVVIIRHGGYLTVYAGLTGITIAKGQQVRTGQNIGTIWTNPDADNRTELHFEVRHERTKLNPLQWVR